MNRPELDCPFCGMVGKVHEELTPIVVETVYGSMKVEVILLGCGECLDCWTDYRGEEMIDRAVLDYENS